MQEQKVEVPEEVSQSTPSFIPDGSVASHDPVAVANAMYGTYIPRFKLLMQKIKGKAKDRVINAIIEVPLNERDFRPQSTDEKEAFLIGQSLLNAKRIIIESVLMKHEEELHKAKQKAEAEAKSEEHSPQGENENG